MKSLALSLLFLGLLGSHAAAASTKPNLIAILADDLGWADLSAYGNKYNETPNIDRLAQQGMRFTQAYSGPVCSPTRANLQSGQDQARFGITQHIPGHRRPYAKMIDPVVASHLPLEVETFAEQIGAAGYRTGYFGKWHLGGAGFSPTDQGWQTALEIQGNTVPLAVSGGTEPRRMAEFLTEKAVAFIESAKGQPFLLQVSHYAVHIPLSTTPALLKKYQDRKPMPGYPSNPQYAGLLEELDQSVGKIVETVDRLGLGENTLIVFISDNGGLEHEQSGRVVTSNQPLRGEKGCLYEGGIRTPAVVRWTGKVPAKTTSDTPIITMDWHPTLTALAGASAKKSQPKDGVSLASLIMNPRASLSRDTLTWHLPHYHHSTPASAIRRGDWKLIEFFEDGRLELYNLANDLGEKNNLARREPARAKELQAALATWRQKVGAQMPVPNPQYDPARASELGKGAPSSRKKAL